jgi:hypothetical protein
MTELVTIDAAKERALSAILGLGGESEGSSTHLPLLKINLDDEDDEGTPLPRGKFMITGQEDPVYADKVRIRPLSQMFQWVHYDPDQNKAVNRTLIIPNFRSEARDEKGGIRCGKPPSKVLRENPEMAKQYKNITCFRLVHCLVSYEGKTASGEKVTVENVPTLLRLKGANFSGFEEQVADKLPKGKKLYDFWVEISATKKKNGSVTYYVYNYAVDLGNPVALDQPTYDTMLHIVDIVKAENTRVQRKYDEAVRGGSIDSAAMAAVEIIDAEEDSLEEDLVD